MQPLALSGDLPRRARERIERGAEGDCRGLRLLALADHLMADGIVTDLPSVLDPRSQLFQHHRFRIIPPEDLADFVEICAQGHGVSCAAHPASPSFAPGGLYQFMHWKAWRLFKWFNTVNPSLAADTQLRELLRSALLNRYPFILRARDMVKFYQIQIDHHARRNQTLRAFLFREPLNYHLTTFYVHVWGMLDTLAQIANKRLDLGVEPFRCYFTGDDFRQALGKKRPGLSRFIAKHGSQWVSIIADIRHPVAHSALRVQGDVVADTPESLMSDEDIAAILREEDPEFYDLFPPHLVRGWEEVRISNWRMEKRKVVTDDAIYVEKAEGGYIRQPVASIDFDVERLNAFIDAFLVGCFGTHPATETATR